VNGESLSGETILDICAREPIAVDDRFRCERMSVSRASSVDASK
jgi:hypothetical protein